MVKTTEEEIGTHADMETAVVAVYRRVIPVEHLACVKESRRTQLQQREEQGIKKQGAREQ